MDFRQIGTVDGSQAVQRTFAVVDGTDASIAAGDVVVISNGYAVKVATGGCASAGVYGIAKAASTETSAVAGTVVVDLSPNGLILRGVPTTPGNLAPAILFDRVTMDVTGGVQTVDENDPNGILTIWDYDTDLGTIDVVLTATV